MNQPTEASTYLISLARKNAQVYAAMPGCRAIMVTGSAVEGVSDFYSDLDMITYFDAIPSEEALAAAREANGGENVRPLGPRTEAAYGEQYRVKGVECQVGYSTVPAWETEMASVLEGFEVETPLQKALSGMLEAIPLHGEALIRQWQERLRQYPDGLAEAMVRQNMAIFPLWGLQDSLDRRDAAMWMTQTLAESASHLLGIFAGLNRLYYSSFQFKRMHRFVDKMAIKPEHFADRLDSLVAGDLRRATATLESLVGEAAALVEQHMPQADTAPLRRRLGWRQTPWEPTSEG
jgi:hypothetical protein